MAVFVDAFDPEYRRKLMERALAGDEEALVALGIRQGKPKKDVSDGWRPTDTDRVGEDLE